MADNQIVNLRLLAATQQQRQQPATTFSDNVHQAVVYLKSMLFSRFFFFHSGGFLRAESGFLRRQFPAAARRCPSCG